MVRPKPEIAPEKEAEMAGMLKNTKEKFKSNLRDLEMAKREFSTAYAEAMSAEFRKMLPKNVLDMKVGDFVKLLNDEALEPVDEDKNGAAEQQRQGTSKMAETPAVAGLIKRPVYYKSLKTPAGVHIKVPSYITPRVHGSVQQPRASKYGEILFSVRGTPVMNGVTKANMMEAKKEEAMVQNLLQQEELLTPESRKIIAKLKTLVKKRAEVELGGGESD